MGKNGGKRPGAGRPSLVDESVRAIVVTKCWSLLQEFFTDPKESRREKIKVAQVLASKAMPNFNYNENSGSLTIQMPSIKIGEKPLEFSVGSPKDS